MQGNKPSEKKKKGPNQSSDNFCREKKKKNPNPVIIFCQKQTQTQS